MPTVTTIQPKRKVLHCAGETQPMLRVAAYCRVSTDSDEQESSYQTQIDHYTDYISNHPGWQLAGIFADDGISDTDTKKRVQFNRMIAECEAGNIDMVLTKSISRFARNTLDCLKYIRQLKEKNIAVYFEKESINTLDSKGEVLLTIMASLAQNESQSLSQNVKMGLQYRYQQGKVQINHNWFLGYTKDENGNLIIDPEQAEVVRRIYREFLEGGSPDTIARGLERDGIHTGSGRTKWYPSTVKRILSNEKYIGDALLQKTYTVDFLTKKRVINDGGIAPQYYVRNSHEAIISRELYARVQKEIEKRNSPVNGQPRQYKRKYCFSQIVYCSECGHTFRRVRWNNNGCRSDVWRCQGRIQKKLCKARTVNELLLKAVAAEAIRRYGDEVNTDGTEQTFDEKLVRQLVEKITVYDDRFVVEFKSGEKVEIDK